MALGTRETCMCKSGVEEREKRQQMISLCYSKCYKGIIQEVCPRATEPPPIVSPV